MSLTHYGTLGVDRIADAEEVKAAYRAKARDAHPDRGGDHDTMAALTVAYDVLGNAVKRRAYDEQLRLLGTTCQACNGAGRSYKQKGFTARVAISCKACGGEGYVALAARTNTINVGSQSKTKKRRVK